MSAFLYPLASGSLGNSLLVSAGRTRVLVDMGISRRRLRADLAGAGAAPEDIRAVLLTHTHSDHFSASAAAFCLARRVPVYSAAENLAYLAQCMPDFADLVRAGLARPIDGGPLVLGDLAVEAFPVPHDSAGACLGFRLVLGSGRTRRTAAVATDLGHVPAASLRHFLDCDAVVLESNHDPRMLRESGRPPDLIERIAGPHGHLSNSDCAEAVAGIVGRSRPARLRHVVLAHLSRDCNTPRLALAAQAALARRHCDALRIFAAGQYEAGPAVDL
ncbi:MAG: MBL fold metallo-hydrolase [Planctomycetes bacterium]|nr:MBL fold metallo-hydrolase [Planctomycetota bacterium]